MKGRLLPPAERALRIATKEHSLLRFLRTEHYTTSDIAGQVMGLNSRQATHSTLKRIESRELIRAAQIELATGRRIVLWGITAHGQAQAYVIGEETPLDRVFEPGRVGQTVIQHTLDLQRLRLQVEAAGWTDWLAGDRIGKWTKGEARPDALVTNLTGEHLAIEVERTTKTRKRYACLIVDRLLAIKAGRFSRVIYACPTMEQATRLAGLFATLQDVTVHGQRVSLTERHRAAFAFTDYAHILEH